MIRFTMANSGGPPWRLSLIWVELMDTTSHRLSSIIWIMNLLAGLNKLHVDFSQEFAVCLLQVLENLLIVSAQEVFILNRD